MVATFAELWGSSGPAFLRTFALLGSGAVALTFAFRLVVTRLWRRRSLTVELTATQLGMLVSDHRAVLAALTNLRAGGLISRVDVARPLSESDRKRFDSFTITMYHRYLQPELRTVPALLVSARWDLHRLRASLVKQGLLADPPLRKCLYLTAAPIGLVAALGAARIWYGVINGSPVLYLTGLEIMVVTAWAIAVYPPRRTAAGSHVFSQQRRAHRYLDPAANPAYATYGIRSAGLSAALFGGAALLQLDPGLAIHSQALVSSPSLGGDAIWSGGGSGACGTGGGSGGACGGGGGGGGGGGCGGGS